MLRRIARVFAVLLLLFIGLVLFVRSPWGQDIIVSKVTNYVSKKTNTKVEIDHLFVTFSGNIFLEGLYLEDKKGDTLVYSKTLEANLPLSPLLFGDEINLKSITWEGLRAKVIRSENSEKFNFDFLLDAFFSQDPVVSTPESEPLQINIGSLDFKDFNIDYNDAFLGIESHLQLGELFLNANKTDLENLRFELDELELSDTEIVYRQTKPIVTEEDTAKTQLPFLSVENLAFENVTTNYISIPDSVSAEVTLGDFLMELPKMDLSKNDIEIDLLALKNSTVSVQLPNTGIEQDSTILTTAPSSFEWPEFLVKANKIVLENNTINYNSGKTKLEKGKFNPDAIALYKLNLKAGDLEYQPENLLLQLDRFSFLEKSGFQLRNLSFDASLKNTSASLSRFRARTNSSFVNGAVALKYLSLEKIINAPEIGSIDLQIPDLELAVQDAFFFQPDLKANEYLNKLVQHPFKGNISANGTLDSVQIETMQLKWGENTSLSGEGRLSNVTQSDSLSFDFDTVRALSIREDILEFVSEKEMGISIPQTVLVDAKLDGNLNNMNADAQLKIPEGKVQLTGNYQNQDRMQFDGNLKVDSLRLDKLLDNEQLGGLSFTMDVSGGGKNLNTLNAEIVSDFSQLKLLVLRIHQP